MINYHILFYPSIHFCIISWVVFQTKYREQRTTHDQTCRESGQELASDISPAITATPRVKATVRIHYHTEKSSIGSGLSYQPCYSLERLYSPLFETYEERLKRGWDTFCVITALFLVTARELLPGQAKHELNAISDP